MDRKKDWGILLLLVAPALVAACVASVQGRIIALRDGAHFYEPLYGWIAARCESGDWPLWNPLENAGVSLAADPTAALWYPIKLLLLLPLPWPARYNAYLAFHFGLAAAGTYRLARHWGRSRSAAALSALSYTYGAPFLFQYSNVIFLVGAAWLPWGMKALDRVVGSTSWRAIPTLSTVLALMVLGGDPQAAYHLGLLGLLRLAVGNRTAHGDADAPSPALPWSPPSRRRVAGRLLISAAIAFVLSAVQVLPTWKAVGASDRMVDDVPRTVWECLAARETPRGEERPEDAPRPNALARWLANPEPDTHHAQIYDFSVGPWRWIEMVWPNVAGRMFPSHRRWLAAIPAEGRVWCPSLFVGVLPLLLGLTALTLRKGSSPIRWLSWTTVLALLATCGWYGGGWMLAEFCGAAGIAGPSSVGAPTGGLYWMLVTFLPGYVSFRYPAKWSVVAALAIALLSAFGCDAVCSSGNGQSDRATRDRNSTLSRQRFQLLIRLLAIATLVAAVVFVGALSGGWWRQWSSAVPADPWLGPFDAAGSARDVACGLVQTTVIVVIAWLLLRCDTSRHTTFVLVAVFAVTALDLIVANAWLVASLPARETLIPWNSASDGHRVYRGHWEGWLPSAWSSTSSPRRLEETIAWERASRFPKTNLTDDVPVVSTDESLLAREWKLFLDVACDEGTARPDDVLEPRPDALAMLDIGDWYLPPGIKPPGLVPSPPLVDRASAQSRSTAVPQLDVWTVAQPLGRTWLVPSIEVLPPLVSQRSAAVRQRTREVLSRAGRPSDWQDVAVVETLLDLPPDLVQPGRATSELRGQSRIVVNRPNLVEIEVNVNCTALCVLSDRFDDDWKAELRSSEEGAGRPVEILRTNRLLRGVVIPPGRHRLVFDYRPLSVRIGGWLTILGWTLLAAHAGNTIVINAKFAEEESF